MRAQQEALNKESMHGTFDGSNVGRRIKDLINRRVIVVVLAMLFIVPLFESATWSSATSLRQGGLVMLAELSKAGAPPAELWAAIWTYNNRTEGLYCLMVRGGWAFSIGGDASEAGLPHRRPDVERAKRIISSLARARP